MNTGLADLEPLDDQDEEFLRGLLARHLAETGSAVAARLLRDWAAATARFARVMPKDYKRVLAAASAAGREGRDVNQAAVRAGAESHPTRLSRAESHPTRAAHG